MALSPVCLASLGGKIVKILTQEECVRWQQTQAEASRLQVREQKGGPRRGAGRGCLPPSPQGQACLEGGPTKTLLKISEPGGNPLLFEGTQVVISYSSPKTGMQPGTGPQSVGFQGNKGEMVAIQVSR